MGDRAEEIAMREITEDDTEVYRELRLEGLRISPDSFEQSYEDEVKKPIEYWQDMVDKLTPPSLHTAFFLFDGASAVGVIHGFVRGEQNGSFGGLWVHPDYRRRGLARRLVKTILAWAGEQGMTVMRLWTVDGSEGPLRLYQQFGFEPTGESKTLVSKPEISISEFELTID